MAIDILTLAAAKAAAGGGGGSTSKYKQPVWGSEDTIVLPETELAFAMNEDLGMECAFVELAQALIAGNTYAVNFNGTVYYCESVAADNGGIVVGNGTVLGGTGNNEPFVFVYTEGFNVVLPLDGSATATMSVVETTFHEIPQEYLGTKQPLIVRMGERHPQNNTYYKSSETVEAIHEAVKSGRLVYLNADEHGVDASNLVPLIKSTVTKAIFGTFDIVSVSLIPTMTVYEQASDYIAYRHVNLSQASN